MGVEDLPNTWRLSLNLGGVLGEPLQLRGEAEMATRHSPRARSPLLSSLAI